METVGESTKTVPSRGFLGRLRSGADRTLRYIFDVDTGEDVVGGAGFEPFEPTYYEPFETDSEPFETDSEPSYIDIEERRRNFGESLERIMLGNKRTSQQDTVVTPGQFFLLPDYLQRKIMIEELSDESINNLCTAAKGSNQEAPRLFYENICRNAEVWRAKFQYDFPTYFPEVVDNSEMSGAYNNFFFWKRFYRLYSQEVPKSSNELLWAVRSNNVEGVKESLKLGADPNITSDGEGPYARGITALIGASNDDNADIVKLLLKAGANPNLVDRNGSTALIVASQENHTDIVPEMLLKAGADPNLANIQGNTALMNASFYGNTDIVKILLESGAELNLQNEDGMTALMVFIFEFLKAYELSFDFDIDIINPDVLLLEDAGTVPFMLLNAGTDPNIQDINGNTALHYILNFYVKSKEIESDIPEEPYLEIIFTLLRYKPNPFIPNNKGETAVSIASENGLNTVLDALLYLGILDLSSNTFDLNPTELNEVLIRASETGRKGIVEKLLKLGANPNLKDKNGDTALIWATRNGHTDIVEMLLNAGADPNIMNKWGRTAITEASRRGLTDIVKMLSAY